NLREDHPLRLVARREERLDQLQALGELLRLEFGGGFRDLLTQIRRHLLKIERLEHLADRFRADHGGEAVLAEFVLRLQILVFGQQLTVLQRGEARLQHNVIFEIENALEVLQRHVEQQTDAARQRLQEPDMRDRRGQFDMAHALAPHAAERDLDRALLADDALVLHALVLAAQALVVLDRAEDARTEQAVAFRLERAVVDGLRLFDLAVGPGQNLFRARDRDLDLIENLRRHLRAEQIHHFLVHRLLLDRGARLLSGRRKSFAVTGTAPSPSRNRRNYSAASAMPPLPCFELCRSTLRPSERISLTSTLKLSGMPASNVTSPRTIASYTLVRPATSSDFTVSISCSV